MWWKKKKKVIQPKDPTVVEIPEEEAILALFSEPSPPYPTYAILRPLFDKYPSFRAFYASQSSRHLPPATFHALIANHYSPHCTTQRARWSRITSHLLHHPSGLPPLLSIPPPVWSSMVAPLSEGVERRQNWLCLLGSCKDLRAHLLGLFELENPEVLYRPLLEGYYIRRDLFVVVEGGTVVRMEKVVDKKGKEMRQECRDAWTLRKVPMENGFRVEMVVETPTDVDLDRRVSLPSLEYQQSPPLPYPVKVNKQGYKRVHRGEYEIVKNKKKEPQMMCGLGWPLEGCITETAREIVLNLWDQVADDYPDRNMLLFSISGILESVSRRLDENSTEETIKQALIKEITRTFPDLQFK